MRPICEKGPARGLTVFLPCLNGLCIGVSGCFPPTLRCIWPQLAFDLCAL